MTWPAVLSWTLIFAGLLSRSPLFCSLFFGFGAFGSLTLLPSESGSVNLLPQAVCSIFLICKIVFSKGQLSRAVDMAIDPAKLGLFFAFTGYAVFSAYAMPRFFAHMVEVIDLNSVVAPWAIPLEPTSANVSQSVYATLSCGIALAFSLAGGNASFRRHYLQAILVGGLFFIATGLADMMFTESQESSWKLFATLIIVFSPLARYWGASASWASCRRPLVMAHFVLWRLRALPSSGLVMKGVAP
jgi:hypothetical protein